ncbi:MAG TPA: hypothetical protein VGM90_09705 [Kofleriaceae bacterium]
MAQALLLTQLVLEIVFHYRTLIGKCELGVGLDWDEIEQVNGIEAAFAPTADDCRMKSGRRFRRESAKLSALLRGDRIHDRVALIEMGPGGFVVSGAPFIARGECIEVIVDNGEFSYRFSAQGVWLKEDGDDYKVGLVLQGMPVRLHHQSISAHAHDIVDEIPAAA